MSFADKLNREVDKFEWTRERFDAELEWSRKPWWTQQIEEGDYHYDAMDGEDGREPQGYPEIKPSTPELAKIFKLMETGRIPY